VAGINDSPWKERLKGYPLTVQHGEVYSVRKVGYPAITITLRHLGDHVAVARDMAQDLRGQYDSDEQLYIGSDGRQVYLQTEGNKRLSVPEEAAQYILKPIIDALKTVKPT